MTRPTAVRDRRRTVLVLALAALAAVGCVVSWVAARTTIDVAPVIPEEPATTTVAYYGPLIFLALVLATVAGVAVVIGVARLRRARAFE